MLALHMSHHKSVFVTLGDSMSEGQTRGSERREHDFYVESTTLSGKRVGKGCKLEEGRDVHSRRQQKEQEEGDESTTGEWPLWKR